MTKTTRVISWTAGIFLLLIVVAIIIIATFDWNRLKPTINQKVSTELNRPFAIPAGEAGSHGRTFTPTTSFWAIRRIFLPSPWCIFRGLKPRWRR